MSVEYLTPSSDSKGRLYARQTCAQNLPRDLRLLLYGGSHREVDISGAHYELIRSSVLLLLFLQFTNSGLGCGESGLPSWIPHLQMSLWMKSNYSPFGSSIVDTVRRLRTWCPWISPFLHGFMPLRMSLSHVRTTVRPHMEAASRNKHFFAVEAIEGIVMQLFLIEVRKRRVAPSILWLHDGFWIDKCCGR